MRDHYHFGIHPDVATVVAQISAAELVFSAALARF
jgi:hypothetical protein